MTRNELNAILREYAKTQSPTDIERALVESIYASICTLFGNANCIQIGSYPRFTATTPLHDLDVLFCLGVWSEGHHDPDEALSQTLAKVTDSYENPTKYSLKASLQNHSIVLEFSDKVGKLVISVDIVPCYSFGTNEYGDSKYMVPQVIKIKDKPQRHQTAWNPSDNNQWVASDPRGYISRASKVGKNTDFRKTVKIVKHWKRTLRDIDDGLKLKSFHLEQHITQMFEKTPDLDIFVALFRFFHEVPSIIENPNVIEDRAQPGKYIDDYLQDLTPNQKDRIKKARDNVLVQLEEMQPDTNPDEVFTAEEFDRDIYEQFMFDHGIPMLTGENLLDVGYDQLNPSENRALRRLRRKNKLPRKKELHFKVIEGQSPAHRYYWKVQNSKSLQTAKERRGEITANQTKNNPERTEFIGSHYVECFAVDSQGICVDRAQCEVVIGEA